jgi:hypothetical protein
VLGRPLFTRSPSERARYLRDSYLLASSYGPVYGILRGDGRSLYVVDGINYVDAEFDLTPGSPPRTRSPAAGQRASRMAKIREAILEIESFHGVESLP